jgi:general secretion pathway protein B
MSYILDALRKSDQQRQHGKSPTLLTAQVPVAGSKRPSYLLNGLLAAILLCSGIVVGWLRPWQTKQPVPAAEPVASMPNAPSPPPIAPMPLSGPSEMAGTSGDGPLRNRSTSAAEPANLTGQAATNQATPALADNGSASPLPHPDSGLKNATPMQLPSGTASAGTAAEEGKRVMALNELPASVQREIPSIAISFHAYSSNPKERRVMITGDMLVQGEALAPGLSLDEITPDGVILGYKGYRFHQGVR